METTRTIVLKLHPTAEQAAELNATLKAFAAACDFIADVACRDSPPDTRFEILQPGAG